MTHLSFLLSVGLYFSFFTYNKFVKNIPKGRGIVTEQELKQHFEQEYGNSISFLMTSDNRVAFIDAGGLYCDGVHYDSKNIAGIEDGIFWEKSLGMASEAVDAVSGVVTGSVGCVGTVVACLGGFTIIGGFCGKPSLFPVGLILLLGGVLVPRMLKRGRNAAVVAAGKKTCYLKLHMANGIEKEILSGFPEEKLKEFLAAWFQQKD